MASANSAGNQNVDNPAYDEPWDMNPGDIAYHPIRESGSEFAWRLFKYLSTSEDLPRYGTSEQLLMERRQEKFLIGAGVVAIAWIVGIFI